MDRLLVVAIGMVVFTGCAAARNEPIAPCPLQEMSPEGVPVPVATTTAAHPASGLIFDRHPGWYSADQFTWRSDWPSTRAYYRAPELIFYREHFHDYQGPGFNSLDFTYRRFDTVRYGAAVR